MENDIIIYLCDDNHKFINIIEDQIENILTSQQKPYEITTFSNGEDLLIRFDEYSADIVFLDIDMPSMTGFEAAEKLQAIKDSVHIVFISSHEDKVFQSYEFHPFWFVRKSHLEDMGIVLPKLLVKIDSDRKHKQGSFKLRCENGMVEVDINKIKIVSAYKHYIFIKDTSSNEQKIRCRLCDAEKQLYPFNFIRVQNGVIVNCRFISKVNSRAVIMLDGEKINISRDKVEYVKNEFQKFMRSI